MVFGTFDILHDGHLNFLCQAKKQGDFLIIVVAQDKNVLAIKGRHPLGTVNQRIKALESRGLGDKVIPGDNDNFFKAIELNMPELICLGYDQDSQGLEDEIIKRGWKIEVKKLKPYKKETNKTSIIRKNNGF